MQRSLGITIQPETVVLQRLSVVAHKNDDGGISLPRSIEMVEQAPELVIRLFDHRVVRRLGDLVME